ncbi:MAG: glycosyltransferase [Oscillospiraceae bacterium]|nr:glycosyltransferase [Oscillospiraceae bacterium]
MNKEAFRPRASIIIIAYNTEKTIERAIQSACAQTVKEIEIICVDDGSTDSTRTIMQACAVQDVRIRVLTQPNSGTLAARTAGIRQAAGKYTLFLDSDDLLRPEAVQTACDAADQLGTDVLEFDVELIEDPNNPPKVETMSWLKTYFSQEYPLPEAAEGPTLVNACFDGQTIKWVLWTKLWRTELLREAVKDYRGEWLCVSEDQLIILMALLSAKRYARIETSLYIYFVGGGMTTMGERFTDPAVIKKWGTKWLALTLARDWLQRRGCTQDEIASGTASFARVIRENTVYDLLFRCAPECRADYLGWLAQNCTWEELLVVVCEAIEWQESANERLEWYKESFDIISNSTCWRMTAPLRFVLDSLKGNR